MTESNIAMFITASSVVLSIILAPMGYPFTKSEKSGHFADTGFLFIHGMTSWISGGFLIAVLSVYTNLSSLWLSMIFATFSLLPFLLIRGHKFLSERTPK